MKGEKLEVRVDNPAARGLYAKLGYVEDAVLPGYYDDGTDGLRLRHDCFLSQTNWSDGELSSPVEVTVKIRYNYAEVRAIARERVGIVKPSQQILPKTTRKKPKHKKPPEASE